MHCYNGCKVDLTLGHRYPNSETHIWYILLRISIAESFKVLGHSVQLWRTFKLFLMWGNLTWPGDLALSDLGPNSLQHVQKDVWIGVPKTAVVFGIPAITWGGVQTPPGPARVKRPWRWPMNLASNLFLMFYYFSRSLCTEFNEIITQI